MAESDHLEAIKGHRAISRIRVRTEGKSCDLRRLARITDKTRATVCGRSAK